MERWVDGVDWATIPTCPEGMALKVWGGGKILPFAGGGLPTSGRLEGLLT